MCAVMASSGFCRAGRHSSATLVARACRVNDRRAPDRLLWQCGGMSGLFGWHLAIVIAVIALFALVVLGVYWVVRLAVRHGRADSAAHRGSGIG